MDLTILTWNVEHFNGTKGGEKAGRVQRVIDTLRTVDPDIFGILEVEGSESFSQIATAMQDYSFLLTEGQQVQEILIGFRRNMRMFFTQRGEFKENNVYLRPAPLVTFTTDTGTNIPILFTHFKSSREPAGFGLRASMFEKVGSLKKAVDKFADRQGEPSAPMIVLGDMNTMGMNLVDSNGDQSAGDELQRIDRRMRRVGMRRLPKSHPHTFSDGARARYPDSDLDHIYVDDRIIALQIDGHDAKVGGWAEFPPGPARNDWVARNSDHAPVWARLRIA